MAGWLPASTPFFAIHLTPVQKIFRNFKIAAHWLLIFSTISVKFSHLPSVLFIILCTASANPVFLLLIIILVVLFI